jgi:DNA-binding NarL/FixJ family response regulator
MRLWLTEHPRLIVGVLLLIIAGGWAIDIFLLDEPHSIWSLHMMIELSVVVISVGSIGFLWLGWKRQSESAKRARAAAKQRRAERNSLQEQAKKLLHGLGEAIDEQLRRWGLTDAERETALLLLKGCPHREIATLLGKSERTVRQHSVEVYKKSGLAGRAELAAFFLEDLLPPPHKESGQS